MEKGKTHIDDQLKGMFNSFEPSVPFAFDAIADRLEERKSKRRIIFWATSAAVVFTAVSGFYFFMPDTAQVKIAHQVSVRQNPAQFNTTPEQIIANKNATSNIQNRQNDHIHADLYTQKYSSNRPAINQARSPKMPDLLQLHSLPIAARTNLSATVEANLPITEIPNTENIGVSNLLEEQLFPEIFGGALKTMPNTLGNLLQLPERIQLPQMPQQPLSSWAFEVGYDQNQTAMAYQISPGREKYVHKNYLNRVNEGEFALNAPQLQASVKYNITPRWAVLLGLGFAQTRIMQNFDFQDSVPFSVAQGNSPDALGNYPIFGYLGLGQKINYEGTQSFQMLSIPLGLSYNIPMNRFWSVNTEISARYNRIFGSNGKALNYHDLSLQEANSNIYRSEIWSARFSAGVEYRMGLRQFLGLRLNTQGALSPYYLPNAAVINRGWSGGLSVFYTYKLF